MAKRGKAPTRPNLAAAGIAASVALLVAGCGSPRITAAQAGAPPQNYRAVLRSFIRTNYFDPYSLRDVAVSEPVPGRMMLRSGWIVCFQANAKNRMGGYAGLRQTAFLFQGDELVESPDANAIACEGVPLAPWPEMEGR